ncbi:YbaB/EbfC family nucleoid-associated protein [bacterium]|jgi:hypothetical protein|nr:YbaB/EbfC family nucleoid-associated protein [bacterium]MBR6244600.1 YbaB/EbfC family nucleoid-associated protein [bacterium]
MNIQGLMQQAQRMQKKMIEIETEFKKEIFETEAGGGAVKVTMNGNMEVVKIEVSPDVKSEDIETITDLLIAAVNQSITTVRKAKETRLSKIIGKAGSTIPGLF